jgi:hypothetical protein
MELHDERFYQFRIFDRRSRQLLLGKVKLRRTSTVSRVAPVRLIVSDCRSLEEKKCFSSVVS